MQKLIKILVLALLSSSYSMADVGGDILEAKCGQCHGPDKKGGVIDPSQRAAAQWERFFEKNRHKRKGDITKLFSAKELAAVQKFLVEHAADSDKPIVAGVR